LVYNKNKNKNTMKNKQNLLRLSVGLIIFNLLLGVGLLVSQFSNPIKFVENSSLAENIKPEVLGVNTNIPQFSPNFIMSNSTFSSTRVFPSVQSVQNYLDSVRSPLANYTENGQKAAYWIFAASQGINSTQYGVTPKINPGVIMAYLEKEQSLLSLTGYDTKNDPDKRLKTAMGYGCPDDAKCNTEYYGFANQVKWASYQLQYNYNNANNQNFSHTVNKTVNTLDGYNVFLSNEATASNYRYTPHAYWGNYNLWKIITANGWGVDSKTWSFEDIDRVNIAKIDTNEGFDTEKLKPENMVAVLSKNFNIGDSGGEIILLQRFLRQQGYFTYSEITGTFGNITKKAFESYKTEKGVPVVTNTACTDLYKQNWSLGQSNDQVKTLQECLRKDGVFDYPISTGYFGPVTSSSLDKIRARLGAPAPVPTPAPQPVVNTCDTLKARTWNFGERSEDVKALQQCMRQAGTFSYPENTGYLGSLTQEALTKWKNPVKVAAPVPAALQGCEQIKTTTFAYGERGDRVSALQKCMKDAGIYNWPYITGYFGSVTQEAYSKWKGRDIPQIDCNELKKAEWQLAEESARVKQLQGCMRQAGMFKFSSDTGYFGEVTKQALIKWRGYF
jgi:peptidoglycan hydrolase-like protein with peptidoglycan-binding domain